MKKIVLTIVIVLSSIYLNAQPVPPPSGNGLNGNQPAGGGAPIDGGVGIFLILSFIYVAKNVYFIKNNNTNSGKIQLK